MTELGADEAVYFADAVHPEYQTKPAYGWVKAGSNPAVPTTAGRGQVNIYGAINLETIDAPFVEPTTVDGVSAAQLLAKIEARNPDKRLAMSSGTMPPITKGWMSESLSQGKIVVSICRRTALT